LFLGRLERVRGIKREGFQFHRLASIHWSARASARAMSRVWLPLSPPHNKSSRVSPRRAK
jgi:hypothetical protein